MATEEWIQESLARLESLEEERKRHEDALESASDPATLRMHSQAVERLEVKIRALYAELEAVAAQDGDSSDDAGADDSADDSDRDSEDDDEVVAAAPVRPTPAPVRPTPAPVRPTPTPAPMASPFASAPATSPFGGVADAPASSPFGAPEASPFGDAPSVSPFGSPAGEAPFGSPAAASTSFSSSPAASFDAGDSDSEGSGSKIGLIIGLVLVLGGAGAYFAFGRQPVAEVAPPPPPTELKVIKSGEIPPDTQGPRTAKGGDIDATHGAHIKESERRNLGGGGGGGPSPSSDKPEKKKDDGKTKIEKTDDPLAGIR